MMRLQITPPTARHPAKRLCFAASSDCCRVTRLIWTDGRVEIERYWDVSFAKPEQPLSEQDYVDRFAELFDESVRLRLMADVPLGVFLSGGIDSSAIVSAMSGMVSEPIKTFSVAFDEREANELEYARMVSRAFGTDHHETVVSPQQFFDALPALVYQEDEPIAHPSSVPLYFVSKLASDHVKVVLTGEGSDEMLAGYGKYRTTVYNLAAGRAYNKATPAALRATVRRLIELMPAHWRARQKAVAHFSITLSLEFKISISITSRSFRAQCNDGSLQQRRGRE